MGSRNLGSLGVGMFFAALASGCVARSAYQTVAGEAKGLRQQAQTDAEQLSQLEAKVQDLQGQLARASTDLEADNQHAVQQVKNTYDSLVSTLKNEIKSGEVEIKNIRGKLTISVADRLFFDSGSADIREQGKQVLARVAKSINSIPDKLVRIEGFTDNVPIGADLEKFYATNWELGAVRSLNVVHFLADEGKVDPKRLSATSFGEFRPVASNDSPAGRAKNRHIDIALVSPEIEQVTGHRAAARSEAAGADQHTK